jgi:hypothetical protein
VFEFLGFKLLLQKKKIFLKTFCERLSRSSVEALGCKLLHQKQNLSENCFLQKAIVSENYLLQKTGSSVEFLGFQAGAGKGKKS